MKLSTVLPVPNYKAIKHSKLLALQACISHNYIEFPNNVSERSFLVFSVPDVHTLRHHVTHHGLREL